MCVVRVKRITARLWSVWQMSRWDMLEINVSCPNVKEGGIAFGQDPKALQHITEQVKKRAKQPVIMKLSPNVTDITVMAKAAEAGGAMLSP